MHGDLDADGVVDRWTLVGADWDLTANKTEVSRLGFALSLKYLEAEARFPSGEICFDERTVRSVAEQLAVDRAGLAGYDWSGRTARYHRRQIREHFGFREFTEADEKAAARWLEHEICPAEISPVPMGASQHPANLRLAASHQPLPCR